VASGEPWHAFALRLAMLLAFAVALMAMAPKIVFTIRHGARYPPGFGDYRAALPGVEFYRDIGPGGVPLCYSRAARRPRNGTIMLVRGGPANELGRTGRGGAMRRMLSGMVALFALVTVVSVASASECFMTTKAVAWRTSMGAVLVVGGAADSSAKALGAATDTTAAISLADYCWESPAFATSTTAAPIARVYVVSPNTTANLDSLSFAVDESFDGVEWRVAQGLTAGPSVGLGFIATSKVISFTPTQLASASGGGNGWMYARYIRFRIKIVTGTFAAAKCFIVHPALRLSH
jgi:hypothetical protein